MTSDLLEKGISFLDFLNKEIFIGTECKNLAHTFLENQSCNLASLRRRVLLYEGIEVFSEELFLVILLHSLKFENIDVDKWLNLGDRLLGKELTLGHLVRMSSMNRLGIDIELKKLDIYYQRK